MDRPAMRQTRVVTRKPHQHFDVLQLTKPRLGLVPRRKSVSAVAYSFSSLTSRKLPIVPRGKALKAIE